MLSFIIPGQNDIKKLSHQSLRLGLLSKTMTDPALQNIIDAINHNADLLEKHLGYGVFVHRQTEPSSVWAVEHKLGSLRPLIETYDLSGNRIGYGVERQTQTLNYCNITFAIPVSGIAILRF